ncbi:hypothetical protein L1987_34159 [Smallanthus sonchifolius]|uniref:Uncharacterized protein n=1 Tax=Smallanthus sonchifolius TaxID=185202 RepID=A0ACB9HUR4_9ASTR|nr:hypothetical protein L1987_34159 [Smallanthus sonchifolius]
MFRAMSLRKVHRGYEPLISESDVPDPLSLDAKMIRSTTLPAHFFGDIPLKLVPESKAPAKVVSIEKQVKKVSKLHPLFSLFERKSRMKKATAKPEFSRYMQYIKEGGTWDANAVKPTVDADLHHRETLICFNSHHQIFASEAGRIWECLAQLYAKDISLDDKQGLDEALHREIVVRTSIAQGFVLRNRNCRHYEVHILLRVMCFLFEQMQCTRYNLL